MESILVSKRVFDVTYGFELEFASRLNRETMCSLLNDYAIPILVSKPGNYFDYRRFWYLGVDNSILDYVSICDIYGHELRSVLFKEFPFEQVHKICELLKRRCFLTDTCGLHIHYSYSSLNFISRDKIESDVKRLRMPKKQRMKYCMDFIDKYRPINIVSIDKTNDCLMHYECRVFNASFRPRAIFQNWKTLDGILRKHWNYLYESDLHWYKHGKKVS